jgi:hypothetical protein
MRLSTCCVLSVTTTKDLLLRSVKFVIYGYCHVVNEDYSLLGYLASLIGNLVLMFQCSFLSPSSGELLGVL